MNTFDGDVESISAVWQYDPWWLRTTHGNRICYLLMWILRNFSVVIAYLVSVICILILLPVDIQSNFESTPNVYSHNLCTLNLWSIKNHSITLQFVTAGSNDFHIFISPETWIHTDTTLSALWCHFSRFFYTITPHLVTQRRMLSRPYRMPYFNMARTWDELLHKQGLMKFRDRPWDS